MKILVTGGREFPDYEFLSKILDLFSPTFIVHGDYTGADALAKRYANEHNIPQDAIPAEWTIHGRYAGPIRNVKMLEKHPDAVVIVFPGGAGTKNCMYEAQMRNHIVLETK